MRRLSQRWRRPKTKLHDVGPRSVGVVASCAIVYSLDTIMIYSPVESCTISPYV